MPSRRRFRNDLVRLSVHCAFDHMLSETVLLIATDDVTSRNQNTYFVCVYRKVCREPAEDRSSETLRFGVGCVQMWLRFRTYLYVYVYSSVFVCVGVSSWSILAANHSHNPATRLLCGMFENTCNQGCARVQPTNSTARQDLLR